MFNLFTLFLVAIGLSMDTFSLSIVYGTIGLTKKKIWLLSIIVGLFHFVMPFLGNLIGSIVLSKLPFNPDIVVGIIFILIVNFIGIYFNFHIGINWITILIVRNFRSTRRNIYYIVKKFYIKNRGEWFSPSPLARV